MLIIGAGGHAREVLDVFEKNNEIIKLFFFDDISTDLPQNLYGKYAILRNTIEVKNLFTTDPGFVLGIGNPVIRLKMANKFSDLGGELCSIISSKAVIGSRNVNLASGLNIMHGVIITNDITIGKGTLINANTTIHHNVRIGEYCEISPLCSLTGGVTVGDFSFIGSGVTVIPKVKIGNNCNIGAGSTVINDIPDNSLAVGVPAKVIKKLPI